MRGFTGLRNPLTATIGYCVHQGFQRCLHQLGSQRGERVIGPNRYHCTAVDLAGVQPLLNPHDADAGLRVACQQRSLHWGSSAPTRQQREVHVDHRQTLENGNRNDSAVRHHHTQISVNLECILQLMTHGNTELQRDPLHRTGRHFRSSSSTLVHARDDQRDFHASCHQCTQRWYRHLGRTQVHDASRGADGQSSECGHIERICVRPTSSGMARHPLADVLGPGTG